MTHFYVLLLALGIGVIAGLRTFTAPAVISWAAVLHWINLNNTWASWVGNLITAIIFSVLAVGELFLDKQPKTPPRTAPPSFIGRLISGGFAGAVVGTVWAVTYTALGAGVVGAVLGTMRRLPGARPAVRVVRPRPAGRVTRGRSRSRRWIRARRCHQPLCDTAFRRDRRRRRPGRAPAGRTVDRGRADRCDGGAQAVRRHLRQHRLHPDQDAGGQRVRRAPGPPRRRLRRQHRPGQRRHGKSQGAQGRHRARRPQRRRRLAGRHGRLHGLSRPCPIRRPAHVAGRRRHVAGRPDLPQRRRPRGGPGHPRAGRRRLPHQRVDPRTRHGARASRRRRRQLHRARIRPDVPPVRRPRDRRRERPAAGVSRRRRRLRHHPGDPGERRHRHRRRRRRYPDSQARQRVRTDAAGGRRTDRGQSPVARGRATAQHR